MADDLQNYKLQLQQVSGFMVIGLNFGALLTLQSIFQVEAALLTDPENSELLKLKQDLEEVIELTRDLIKTQLSEQKKSSYVEPSRSKPETSTATDAEPNQNTSNSNSPYLASGSGATAADPYFDEIEAALLAAEQSVKATKIWKIGDKCQAKWTEDGNYYDATIDGISATGDVNVIFDAYQNRSSTTLTELKERVVRNEVFPSTK